MSVGPSRKKGVCQGNGAGFEKGVHELLYQFMDKFFTPGYLIDIVAARK